MKNLVLFGIFSLAALSVNAQELLMSEPQDGWVHYSTSQYGGKISEKYTQGSVLEAVQSGKPHPYGSAVVGIEYEDEGGRKGRLIRFIQEKRSLTSERVFLRATATGTGSILHLRRRSV